MAKKSADEKKGTKKRAPQAKKDEELRLKEIEIVHLDLCERDVELQATRIDLAKSQINNMTMEYHRKLEQEKAKLRVAQVKYEQLATIRNQKLAEIEGRLRKIEPDFSFKDYLQQEDGLLIRAEDRVASLDPTAEDGGSTVSG